MIKPLSNGSKTTTISFEDEAVDMTQEAIDAALEATRGNPGQWREYVTLRDGRKPTVFVIGAVPVDDLIRFQSELMGGDDASALQSVAWKCFLHGVRDIEDIEGEIEYTTIDGVRYVAPSWLRRNFSRAARRVAVEIGVRVWQWNQLGGDDVKN